MLQFDVITLFPELFEKHLENLPFKKALSQKSLNIKLHQLRDFAEDKRGTVDDKPYGGGVGMILKTKPIYECLNKIYNSTKIEDITKWKKFNLQPDRKVVALSPKGKTFNQQYAKKLLKNTQITFICGRYEGIDERVLKYLATDVISVGDYVLSGGELPALTIMESITRLIPGVLEKKSALQQESFNKQELEYPQYTRPENFKRAKVPKILLSGHHDKIEKWKTEHQTKVG